MAGDAEDIRLLAKELTTAFPFNHGAFRRSYSMVLENPYASLLVAAAEKRVIGYLLSYRHSRWVIRRLRFGLGPMSGGLRNYWSMVLNGGMESAER